MRAKCGSGAGRRGGSQARPAPQVVVEALVHVCSHVGCAPGELVDVPAPRFTTACASWVPAFTDRAVNSQAKAWLNAGLAVAAGATTWGDGWQVTRGTEAFSGNEASEGTEDSHAGRVGDVDLSGAEGTFAARPG